VFPIIIELHSEAELRELQNAAIERDELLEKQIDTQGKKHLGQEAAITYKRRLLWIGKDGEPGLLERIQEQLHLFEPKPEEPPARAQGDVFEDAPVWMGAQHDGGGEEVRGVAFDVWTGEPTRTSALGVWNVLADILADPPTIEVIESWTQEERDAVRLWGQQSWLDRSDQDKEVPAVIRSLIFGPLMLGAGDEPHPASGLAEELLKRPPSSAEVDELASCATWEQYRVWCNRYAVKIRRIDFEILEGFVNVAGR
jgi:hypothetical protein